MEAHQWIHDATSGQSAVDRSLKALSAAGMTILTNPNMTMATWVPSQPKRPKHVYLACHKDVPRNKCMALCKQWRRGTELACEYVHRKRKLLPSDLANR